MSNLHPEILNEAQHQLLPFIKTFAKEYYLVGGTAVSLQIGHRQSIDFDLFKKSNISKTKIVKRLAEFGLSYQLLYTNSESFHIIVNDVKITFFEYPYPIPTSKSFEKIKIPDLQTLAAMKAFALGRRVKWKDYVDLYFILRDFTDLNTIIMQSQQIYGSLFSGKLFRQQLCYFKDLDYSEEVFYLGNAAVSDETIKGFLTEIATSYD